MKINLSENIRGLRKGRGLTQEQLAEAMGVTVAAVSKWETGMSAPDLSVIVQLAEFFETSVDVLLGYGWELGSMGRAAEEIRELRRKKDYGGACRAAERALLKYPNSFRVVWESAQLHSMMGLECKDSAALRRALELFERLRPLQAQNEDPDASPEAIDGEIARIYIALGEAEKGLDLLKKHNCNGAYADEIGTVLAAECRRPEEALGYLSRALTTTLARLFHTVMGYVNAYSQLGRQEQALEIIAWLRSVQDGVRRPDRPGYLDKNLCILLVAAAELSMDLSRPAEAREYLEEAHRTALYFDSAPDYGSDCLRFHSGEVRIAYDNFGSSAMEGIECLFREDSEMDACLAELWREVAGEA